MSEYQAYGNKHNMIMFSVTITEKMVQELIDDEYLEEDEFDFERYEEETDADYSRILAQPVLDAIISWYEDKVDEYEDKIEETGGFEEKEMWSEFSDLDKIDFISLFEDWKHCSRWRYEALVVVHSVDPENPYKGYIGGF